MPRVSVVTATYNRSHILRHSIASVIAQRLTDWELIVVGDACTDDTADVVASFDDPRIRYHALAANVGEQSGPNNEGVALARGEMIAFLNHDDLWLPDHLALLPKHRLYPIERHAQGQRVGALRDTVLEAGSTGLVTGYPYAEYQTKTSRKIPQFVLEPVN